MVDSSSKSNNDEKHFLGVDIGSSYTKYVVINKDVEVVFSTVIKTLNRNKEAQRETTNQVFTKFNIKKVCATGYGRKLFKEADIEKTEIHCASQGASQIYKFKKTVIDIGGEDLKIIKSAADGKVLDFYMNTKCAAGTGSFLTEISERAEIDLAEMSELAQKSETNKELNSFCTVFAKTEIVSWIINEVPVEDIAKGIYISIVNRIAKLNIDKSLPLYLIGGVIAFHPFIANVMEEVFKVKINVLPTPQFITAFGAACIAKNNILSN